MAGPQATVGKANQNMVQFWCKVEQTSFTWLNWGKMSSWQCWNELFELFDYLNS